MPLVDFQLKKNIVETNTAKHSSVEVKSIFDGAVNQQHGNETRIAAVNVASNNFDNIQTEIFYGEGNIKCSIFKDDIVKAQEENWIKIVKDTIRNEFFR